MQLELYIRCNLFCIAIVLLMLFSMRKHRLPLANQRIFSILLLSTIIVVILDSAAWLMEGVRFPGARLFYLIIVNLLFLFQLILCYIWASYCKITIYGRGQTSSKILHVILASVAVLLFIANQFTGVVCTVDENGYYHRGSLFPVASAIFIFFLLGTMIISAAAYFRDKTDKRKQFLYLALFPVFPIIGIVAQTMRYGLESVWTWVTFALLFIYINVQNRMAEENEKELAKANVSIMLSQIQSHFLYNALGSICVLCTTNPQTAKTAIKDFTGFLRGNMDSLKADKTIPFEQELNHTKNYLDLEKIRFEEQLNVVFDLKTTLFRLPTLTLQPIVENAVRYGATKREEGGTITISTEEENDCFVITVSDDGVGFDPMRVDEDGRTHIGIQNVRDRLAHMCGGTLTITSSRGVGTVARITIPKETEKC